jgi:hypothetical protein
MGEQKDERGPDSLSPVAVEKDSIDVDVAAMNKGNRARIAGLVAVCLFAVGGSVVLLRNIDEKGTYRDAGKTVNSIKKTEFDRFWGCVLAGVNLHEVNSNETLKARIQERSRANGILYARQVRDRCLDILLSAETRLEPSLFPADLRGLVKKTKGSLVDLREAWTEYVTYLTNPSSEFDETRALVFEDRIARGWFGFLGGHRDINDFLRSKLK